MLDAYCVLSYSSLCCCRRIPIQWLAQGKSVRFSRFCVRMPWFIILYCRLQLGMNVLCMVEWIKLKLGVDICFRAIYRFIPRSKVWHCFNHATDHDSKRPLARL